MTQLSGYLQAYIVLETRVLYLFLWSVSLNLMRWFWTIACLLPAQLSLQPPFLFSLKPLTLGLGWFGCRLGFGKICGGKVVLMMGFGFK